MVYFPKSDNRSDCYKAYDCDLKSEYSCEINITNEEII